MNVARTLLAGAALTLMVVIHPAVAEDSWLTKLNPFANHGTHSTMSAGKYKAKKAEPSALAKLGAGTKKFFTGARDLLTGKKPAPEKKPAYQYAPWSHNPKDLRQQSTAKKKSWLSSLFRPEKPKQVESLKDWVGLPRLEP
jgi:hypothetical protein